MLKSLGCNQLSIPILENLNERKYFLFGMFIDFEFEIPIK